MKNDKLFIAIMAGIFSTVTTWIVCSAFYKEKLREEFRRGVMVTAEYYKKHGEFPSYWHWNKKYENSSFNIDTPLDFKIDSVVFVGIDRYILYANGKIIDSQIVKPPQ